MALARLWRAGVTAWMLGTWGVTGWTLSQHPFAEPIVARSHDEARRALDRAVARQASEAWLAAEIEAALAADDPLDIELLIGIADARGIALPPQIDAAARAALGEGRGALAAAGDCAACAWDITACTTLTQLGACAVPVEMTPLGDINALRRNGLAWWTGEEVDELEIGLAALGLGATGAILVSGGAGAAVKAGATLTRTARRIGALSPPMTAALIDAARGLVRWDRAPAVLGGAAADELIDATRAARLSAIAGDVGRISRATSGTETLAILRFADTPDDLARLARLSETAGGETRAALRVLGPARAYRLLDRLSAPLLAALGLIGLVAAQIGGLAGGRAARALAPPRRHGDSGLASAARHRR